MRVKRFQVNKGSFATVILVIFVLLLGWISACPVYAEVFDVEVPYKQTWEGDPEKYKIPDTVEYRIKSADSRSPLPRGSTNGYYSFRLKGNKKGKLKLKFDFSGPGYYNYMVSPVIAKTVRRVDYDKTVYKLTIMVVRKDGSYKVASVTIADSQKKKYSSVIYKHVYHPIVPTPEPDDDDDHGGGGGSKPTGPGGGGYPPEPEGGITPTDEGDDGPDDDDGDHIPDDEPPIVEPGKQDEGEDYWALLNLIMMILTIVMSLLDIITYFRRKKEDDQGDKEQADTGPGDIPAGAESAAPPGEGDKDDEDDPRWKRRKLPIRLLTIVVAIASVILFILTEDMRLPMEWVDEWTIWMIIIFIINVILAFLSREKKKDNEDQEEAGPDGF